MDSPGYFLLSERAQAAGTQGHSEPSERGTRLARLLLTAGGGDRPAPVRLGHDLRALWGDGLRRKCRAPHGPCTFLQGTAKVLVLKTKLATAGSPWRFQGSAARLATDSFQLEAR